MNIRRNQMAHFGGSIAWLDGVSAEAAYEQWIAYSSNDRYGLDDERVAAIEHADADDDHVIEKWLKERCEGNIVRVIFGRDAVFVASIDFFLKNWRDIFCPSRDDALIINEENKWIMFYCHEDEFEFGRIVS